MIHFKHAVDYYKFLNENFYDHAPYFKDYISDERIDQDYNNESDLESYINYEDDEFEFDDNGNIYCTFKFFPPVYHVVEDLALLKYLIQKLMDNKLADSINQLKASIIIANQENKPRKIKHELRLFTEKTNETMEVLDEMIEMGEFEKNDHDHFNLVVANFIITAESIKEAYQKNIDELFAFVKINCTENAFIADEIF